MKSNNLLISAIAALAIGFIYGLFLVFCWAYIAAYSPLPRWLIDFGLTGLPFRSILLPIDFLTSVILSLPTAFVLVKLRPRKLALYVPLAVLPVFIWQNIGLFGNPIFSQFAMHIILGWIPMLFALPVSTWIILRIADRHTSNQ